MSTANFSLLVPILTASITSPTAITLCRFGLETYELNVESATQPPIPARNTCAIWGGSGVNGLIMEPEGATHGR